MQPITDAVLHGPYRYLLTRGADRNGPFDVVWVLLNPSTANATSDDPTLRRVLTFSAREGWPRVAVVNAFALRSTDPRALRAHPAPVGPDNEHWVTHAVERAARRVVAWGNACPATQVDRLHALVDPALCLGVTGQGAPRHPLYVHGKTGLIPWER